jgi:predicted Zn-dependent peptidase
MGTVDVMPYGEAHDAAERPCGPGAVSLRDPLIIDGRIAPFGGSVTRYQHPASGGVLLQSLNGSGEQGIGISVRTVPRDSRGAAHVTEHCVLFAPVHPDGSSIADLARECGLGINAVTTHCHTTFFAKGPRTGKFTDFARRYVDAVFRASFTEDLFRREGVSRSAAGQTSGVVYNEMRDLYASPDHFIRTRIRRELYQDGALAFDPGGAPEDLSALTYESVLDFRGEFYRPERALLFVAGSPTDRDVLRDLAGALPNKTAPKPASASSALRVGVGPSSPRSIVAAYPCVARDDASYMVLSWGLSRRDDEELSWDWDLLERLLFRDRLSRIMRPIRERWSSATPFDIRLERTGPCLAFHFGVGVRQAADAAQFFAIATEAIRRAFAEVRDQDITAALQHSLVDAREDMSRTLNVLAWINGPWSQGADPLVYADPEARARRASARYAASPRALFDRLRTGLFENPQVVMSSWSAQVQASIGKTAAASSAPDAPAPRSTPPLEPSAVLPPRPPSREREQARDLGLPASPRDYACSVERLGLIDVYRNQPNLEGVAYVAVDVELSAFAASEHRDLALVAMLIDRFASGQKPLSDVLVWRKERLSAYLAIPYAACSPIPGAPPVVGLRFALKCPESNFECALTTLEELLLLPLNRDTGLALALPARVIEQQRGFIRNGFFSLVQFAALARVSAPARTKYHWSGQGLIDRSLSALRQGDLRERIDGVRGMLRRGRFRVSFTGADSSYLRLRQRLQDWNSALRSGESFAGGVASESGLAPSFEVFGGAPGAVHLAAAMPLAIPAPDQLGLAEVAIKALSDGAVSPLLRELASAYGASLILDAGHGAVLLSVRSAAGLSQVLDVFERLPRLARELRPEALDDAIRSSAAPFLVPPRPGDATMTTLDRAIAGSTAESRLQRYREVTFAKLDRAQQLLVALFDDASRFSALAASCPSPEIAIARARRGSRGVKEVAIGDLLRLAKDPLSVSI